MNQPLNRAFNVAVNHIAAKVFPCGFDVSADAPQDYDSLVARYRATGRVLVWSGASECTIFADSETNFAFRAWRGVRHILGGHPFTPRGEFCTMVDMMADISAIYDGHAAATFRAIVRARILGQREYQERFGGYPLDQIAFVRDYMTNPILALAADARAVYGVSFEAAKRPTIEESTMFDIDLDLESAVDSCGLESVIMRLADIAAHKAESFAGRAKDSESYVRAADLLRHMADAIPESVR